MKLGERMRRGFLLVLKYSLNPLTRRLARSSFGPFSIIQHVGRRSGKRYETPIIVGRVKDGFVIELTYGPDVEWHKNIVAAGGGTLIWHGRHYAVGKVEPLDATTGRAAFTPLQQIVLRLLGRTHFEKLHFATS